MIPRPSHVQRLDRLKAQVLQIKPLDERIDDANRIVFADPVIEASGNSESCPRSASGALARRRRLEPSQSRMAQRCSELLRPPTKSQGGNARRGTGRTTIAGQPAM
jgi:hypothetical protein